MSIQPGAFPVSLVSATAQLAAIEVSFIPKFDPSFITPGGAYLKRMSRSAKRAEGKRFCGAAISI
jgi:hypothetical protein